jgi:hypothetical protein
MTQITGMMALLVGIVFLTSNSAPAQPLAAALTVAPPDTNASHSLSAMTNSDVAFPPNSLGNLIWTNFIAHTNGKSTEIWSTYLLPPNFPPGYVPGTNLPPDTVPILAWNTNCLMWGMKGETALSQCWTSQGGHGQAPVTALTRRHGYARGHGMGYAGMTSHFNGQRVYFCTKNNQVVEAVVRNAIVEIGSGYDFTILLFSEDLPQGIEPLRVADAKAVQTKYPSRIPLLPWVVFLTEQSGNVSANCAPFTVNTWKGGDSGSPDLLPMPGELVFYSGRSTSGPSPQMQSDMDALSRSAGLDPANYQMQWLDLSSYPTRQ